MPNPATTPELIDLVRKSGIHAADALDRFLADADLPDDPVKCAASLVKRGMLTQFQAKLLLNGRYRGFKVGAYVIREQIGQGGMGTVFLAEHAQLRRRVAIKVLSVTAGDKSAKLAVERFLREARAAAALDHPNIVRIHDVGQHGEVHYLVMEYVDGQTLDKLVQAAGPIACGRAVEYVTQAAAGLQHAYEKGFVHRDIKPANLMLARDGTVKILDMGLARSLETNDKLTEVMDKGAVVGTADYISPEQAMNSPDLDIRADIYSLGASFFTIVAGRPPFEGNTTQKLLAHQMKAAPSLATLDRTFPSGLAEVVAKMLAKKPEDRFQTPGEVITALAPWLPNSAKVVAGISRTDLDRSPALRNTLNEVVTGSTKNLARHGPGAAGGRSRMPLVIGLAAAGVVAVGLGIAALAGAFSSADKTDQSQRGPVAGGSGDPAPPVRPADPGKGADAPPKGGATTTPPVADGPTVPVAAAPRAEGVVYALELTGRRKYTEVGKVLGDPSQPKIKRLMSTTNGDGQLPPDWLPIAATADGAFQGAVDEVGGKLAVGAKAGAAGSPAAMLTPEVSFPSGTGKVTIEYRTDAATGTFPVKIRPTRPTPGAAVAVGDLTATAGAWRTTDLAVDLKGATAGRFELVAGDDPQAGLWIGGFVARDPAPPAGKVVLKLNTAALQPFVQRTVRFTEPGSKVPLKEVMTTGPGKMPGGWYRWIEYPETTAEFFADGPPGAVVLGVRAVAGPGGVQINTPEFVTTGGRCRLRVLYQTGPSSPGFVLRFRPTKPKSGAIFDVATPPATGGSWRLAVLDVDLKGATGGLFEIANGAAGADAALRLREFVVTDPNQPAN
ncbi:MAG: serine/threonine-protein kinase [Gemmataceae bacterium]